MVGTRLAAAASLSVSPSMTAFAIARRLQSCARRLKQLSKSMKVDATPTSAALGALKPGTVLTREWGGVTHRVTVLEEGFAWAGQNYRSLSEIATKISGARWSGPRFFGLKQRVQS